jgi:hypothetical protein
MTQAPATQKLGWCLKVIQLLPSKYFIHFKALFQHLSGQNEEAHKYFDEIAIM